MTRHGPTIDIKVARPSLDTILMKVNLLKLQICVIFISRNFDCDNEVFHDKNC